MILNGILLFTNVGTRLLCKDRKGLYWTKDKCITYCNTKDKYKNLIRSNRLILKSILINKQTKMDKNWYKNPNNFQEIKFDINYNIFIK